ncbi:MAG: DUF4038 domain-containing protein [Deltaproteobacteria bacterium]|nr:DUF4038 domain-containing protein [Deltaproteobacteria bacterium]
MREWRVGLGHWITRRVGFGDYRVTRPARPSRPFFLIESVYENDHNATDRRLRSGAYHAVLSGAAGQVFGNNPMWHFDGPGLYPASRTKAPSAKSQ